MEAEEQEENARRGRWALWIFRLTFYPAALFAAILLIVYRTDSSPPKVTPHAGSTEQGSRFFAGFRDDGFPVLDLSDDYPVYVDTTGWATCSDGGVWHFHFVADEGFALDGDRLRVLVRRGGRYGPMTSRVRFTLDATFDGDEMQGRLDYRELFSPPDAPRFECSAGIRFS